MPNTINADSGAISGVPGVKTTADTSGVLALQADGTTVVTISTTGVAVVGGVSFPAGSAAAPSIAPTGDPNTGMFFPAADTIAFSEGGAEIGNFIADVLCRDVCGKDCELGLDLAVVLPALSGR